MSVPEINGKPMPEHYKDQYDTNWRLVENNIEIIVWENKPEPSELSYWGTVKYKNKHIFHAEKSTAVQEIVNQIVAFVNELRAYG